MKLFILFISCFHFGLSMQLQAQKYSSVRTEISFFSEAPLENIQALNKEGKSIINFSNKEVVAVVPIRGFHFEKSLMEEHFNENFMESDRFKTATLKAKFNEEIPFNKDGVYTITASGKLNIHGVEKDYTIPGELTIAGDKISVKSKFKVRVADHKIEIPQLVIKNIAEVVEISVNFDYEEKK